MPVSLDLKRALEKHGIGDNYNVVRNVVNTNDFIIQDKLKNQFLVVADLENKQKNISGIIKAFDVFNKSNPKIKLKIAGGGSDEKDIKNFKKSRFNKIVMRFYYIVFYIRWTW